MMTRLLAAKRLALFLLFAVACSPQTAPKPARQPILAYIRQSWMTLTRSNRDIARAAPDPKFRPEAGSRWPVYVARGENFSEIEQRLRAAISPGEFATIALRTLPDNISLIREQGLLYLPLPYVVPGGRFNEMYGWDSFFIQLGLLRDSEIELARDMAENFVYEIREYGKVLNANRTYYLGRSQPPVFTEMLLGVFRKTNVR